MKRVVICLEHKCYYRMNLDLISPFLLATIIGTKFEGNMDSYCTRNNT